MTDEIKNKIYVVTAGDYSDYRIIGVFTTEELAEELISKYKNDDSYGNGMRIEEWPLDLDGFNIKGMKRYRVHMLHNGNVQEVKEKDWDTQDLHLPARITPNYSLDHESNKYVKTVSIMCWARDEEHAIKIANEQRSMAIAENRWKE